MGASLEWASTTMQSVSCMRGPSSLREQAASQTLRGQMARMSLAAASVDVKVNPAKGDAKPKGRISGKEKFKIRKQKREAKEQAERERTAKMIREDRVAYERAKVEKKVLDAIKDKEEENKGLEEKIRPLFESQETRQGRAYELLDERLVYAAMKRNHAKTQYIGIYARSVKYKSINPSTGVYEERYADVLPKSKEDSDENEYVPHAFKDVELCMSVRQWIAHSFLNPMKLESHMPNDQIEAAQLEQTMYFYITEENTPSVEAMPDFRANLFLGDKQQDADDRRRAVEKQYREEAEKLRKLEENKGKIIDDLLLIGQRPYSYGIAPIPRPDEDKNILRQHLYSYSFACDAFHSGTANQGDGLVVFSADALLDQRRQRGLPHFMKGHFLRRCKRPQGLTLDPDTGRPKGEESLKKHGDWAEYCMEVGRLWWKLFHDQEYEVQKASLIYSGVEDQTTISELEAATADEQAQIDEMNEEDNTRAVTVRDGAPASTDEETDAQRISRLRTEEREIMNRRDKLGEDYILAVTEYGNRGALLEGGDIFPRRLNRKVKKDIKTVDGDDEEFTDADDSDEDIEMIDEREAKKVELEEFVIDDSDETKQLPEWKLARDGRVKGEEARESYREQLRLVRGLDEDATISDEDLDEAISLITQNEIFQRDVHTWPLVRLGRNNSTVNWLFRMVPVPGSEQLASETVSKVDALNKQKQKQKQKDALGEGDEGAKSRIDQEISDLQDAIEYNIESNIGFKNALHFQVLSHYFTGDGAVLQDGSIAIETSRWQSDEDLPDDYKERVKAGTIRSADAWAEVEDVFLDLVDSCPLWAQKHLSCRLVDSFQLLDSLDYLTGENEEIKTDLERALKEKEEAEAAFATANLTVDKDKKELEAKLKATKDASALGLKEQINELNAKKTDLARKLSMARSVRDNAYYKATYFTWKAYEIKDRHVSGNVTWNAEATRINEDMLGPFEVGKTWAQEQLLRCARYVMYRPVATEGDIGRHRKRLTEQERETDEEKRSEIHSLLPVYRVYAADRGFLMPATIDKEAREVRPPRDLSKRQSRGEKIYLGESWERHSLTTAKWYQQWFLQIVKKNPKGTAVGMMATLQFMHIFATTDTPWYVNTQGRCGIIINIEEQIRAWPFNYFIVETEVVASEEQIEANRERFVSSEDALEEGESLVGLFTKDEYKNKVVLGRFNRICVRVGFQHIWPANVLEQVRYGDQIKVNSGAIIDGQALRPSIKTALVQAFGGDKHKAAGKELDWEDKPPQMIAAFLWEGKARGPGGGSLLSAYGKLIGDDNPKKGTWDALTRLARQQGTWPPKGSAMEAIFTRFFLQDNQYMIVPWDKSEGNQTRDGTPSEAGVYRSPFYGYWPDKIMSVKLIAKDTDAMDADDDDALAVGTDAMDTGAVDADVMDKDVLWINLNPLGEDDQLPSSIEKSYVKHLTSEKLNKTTWFLPFKANMIRWIPLDMKPEDISDDVKALDLRDTAVNAIRKATAHPNEEDSSFRELMETMNERDRGRPPTEEEMERAKRGKDALKRVQADMMTADQEKGDKQMPD